MSGSSWDEYLALLDELDSLADREAEEKAALESRYQQETRRVRSEFDVVEREHKALKHRNSRLQSGIRSLGRQLGVPLPGNTTTAPLAGRQLADAMKSAEYDLEQLRRSLEFVSAQTQSIPPTSAPSSKQPTIAAPVEKHVGSSSAPRKRPIVIWSGIAAALIVIVILALVL